MAEKRTWTAVLLTVVLLGVVPFFSLAAPNLSEIAQEGTNLLKNPGFEGITCAPGSEPGWCLDNWARDTHDGIVHDNIFTPQGWVTWWRKGDGYGQPEVKTIPKVDPFIGPPSRIRSGNYAVLFFTYYRNQDGGFYQVVTGLEPGATVQFSAYAHGWSCNEDGEPYTCGDPWNQTFRVGIEPSGVADPFSPSVVWSQAQRAPDAYTLIGPVTAQVGEGGSVCVLLRSKTKWAHKHLDAYWDDASLVMTSPGVPATSTPLPPPDTPTPGPSPTAPATATPRPDGATVHTVRRGETLFGIALMYGVDLHQIRELNAGSVGPNDLISVGQELVISVPSETPTPTLLPSPPTPEPSPVSPTPEGASICVLAYHDRDGDTFRDEESEELLPNAEFVVANSSGVVDRYTSDGISEPYCFAGLASGAYRVIQGLPPGYEPSTSAEQTVALAEGTTLNLAFGNVRAAGPAAPGQTAEATPTSEGEIEPSGEGSFSRILSILAKVSGVLVLILAAAMAVLFVLNRRRM